MTAKTPRKKPLRLIAKPSSKKSRRVGRPRSDHEQVGEDVIIQKACKLMRKHGAKVSLREIARQLNINLSLINYYFGGRKGLLTAVVHRVAEENRARHRQASKSNLSAAEKIRRRVNDYLLTIEANPFFHELLIEFVWVNRSAKSDPLYKEITTEPFAELDEIIRSANPAFPVDNRLLHIAILAMCEYTVPGKPLIDALVGDSSSPNFRSRYRRFVSDLIINGLRIPE